ncbi:MAG TPA: hypothetical protein VKM56_12855, partial [Verrucomicrobiae bacterium]|nr:hypothetical protein [Verrucomicrobiae bacterium]
MKSSPVACLLIVAALTSNLPLSAAEAPWSDTVNGLQARLTLIEKPKLHGTRWLVPFMELRNARDLANSMEVACDNRHLKVELVD